MDLALLLQKAKTHPILVKIREDERKETLKKRTAAAEEIKRLKTEQMTKWNELHEDELAKKQAFEEAQKAYDNAMNEYGEAQRECTRISWGYNRMISAQKEILHESYDSIVDKTIDFFNSKLDWLRKSETLHIDISEKISPITLKKKTNVTSNFQAINAALAYCRTAIKKLENEVKFLPVAEPEMIESLKNGIPAIPYT